jgi:hypothetical protein
MEGPGGGEAERQTESLLGKCPAEPSFGSSEEHVVKRTGESLTTES